MPVSSALEARAPQLDLDLDQKEGQANRRIPVKRDLSAINAWLTQGNLLSAKLLIEHIAMVCPRFG